MAISTSTAPTAPNFLEGRTSWPNDEAFVASSLSSDGFHIRTLHEHAPGFTTNGTLTFTRPVSLKSLSQRAHDNAIYHPVVTGEAFGARALAYLAQRDAQGRTPEELRREFGFGFQHELHLEGGAPMLARFRHALNACLQKRERDPEQIPTSS